jgi:hypothetical protein
VDFAITWEQGQLYYVGYWLATSSPANQTLLFDLDFSALGKRWNSLSNQGNRMTRIQAFPKNDAPSFAALFEPGNAAYILWNTSLGQFPNDVADRWSGVSLAGLTYGAVNGNIAGAFLNKYNSAQFVWNQDWTTLSAQDHGASVNRACKVEPPRQLFLDRRELL